MNPLTNKLLSHVDRKRYYKISLFYEPENYMQQEYGIGYA
jgi:hypothetical protein